jgi:hypothetical protein
MRQHYKNLHPGEPLPDCLDSKTKNDVNKRVPSSHQIGRKVESVLYAMCTCVRVHPNHEIGRAIAMNTH